MPVIFDSSRQEVTTQLEIEQAHFEFYSDLYTCARTDLDLQHQLLSKLDISLVGEQQTLCEGPLSLDEISCAMRGLSKGKTPGSDGLPQEFYSTFWGLLGPILLELFTFSFTQGCSSPSMQASVTRLIFKKNDKRDPRNWRPISLLNVDYEICSKDLANCLSKVLPVLLHQDQTCSVPGRTIFDNLMLLRDTLDYVNLTQEPGILLSLDQEKSFDRVDCSFLMNTIHRFGFGQDFRRWISTLYFNASMRVIVNGFLTDSIQLSRGVRQGDPLSPLLYVLCAKVFAANIRSDSTIEGFLLPGSSGRHFKIWQYADDCTCFVKDPFSLDCLFLQIHNYEAATGAKLNVSKTEAMWLGAWRSCTLTLHGLSWVSKMKILGV